MDVIAYATADWHVTERRDRGPWAGCPDVRGDDLFVLSQIADLCVKDDVPLLAAGDLTDGPDPDPDTIAALYTLLRPVLKIFYVLGNHERGRDWLAPLGPSAIRVDGRSINYRSGSQSIRVSGLSYTHPDRFDDQAAKVPAHDIGLFHQTWSELCGGGRTSLNVIPDNRLSVCGDVHVRAVIGSGNKTILSPGPISPQAVPEFDEPLVYAVRSDFSVLPIKLLGRKFVSLSVDTPDDVDRVLARVASVRPTGDIGPPSLPFVSIRTGPGIDADGLIASARSVNPDVAVRVVRHRRTRDPEAPEKKPQVWRSLADTVRADQSLTDVSSNLAVDLLSTEDRGPIISAHRSNHGRRQCAESEPSTCATSDDSRTNPSTCPDV